MHFTVPTYIAQDRCPMRITDIPRFVVVDLHDTNRLGQLLRITLLGTLPIIIVQLYIFRRMLSGADAAGVAGNDRHSCRGACGLRSIGHQREHQALKTIYSVLHVVG